jgi:hypothetical protein
MIQRKVEMGVKRVLKRFTLSGIDKRSSLIKRGG